MADFPPGASIKFETWRTPSPACSEMGHYPSLRANSLGSRT